VPENGGGGARTKAAFSGKRVLVADPDKANLDLLAKALASKGCQVGATTSGIEALDMLREDEYHLIIAESALPDLDGFTFFETSRYDPRTGRIPFVFLTADPGPENRQRAVQLGADGYLVKPVPAKELFRICEELLRRSDSDFEGAGASDLGGRIGTFGVEEIVQILQAGAKTGQLVVRTPKATADIFFDRGDIFNANFAGIEGDEAIYLIFAVKEGHFSFRSGVKTEVRNIAANVASLLLEGMRRMDEARQAVTGYQEGRSNGGEDQSPRGGPAPTVPQEMKPFMPDDLSGPSVEQVPDPGMGGVADEDFAVSFDDEGPLEEVQDGSQQPLIPEPEPLPGKRKRLAGAPPPAPPKGAGPKSKRRAGPKGQGRR